MSTLADSNKIRQYLYCKIPILAPISINSTNPNIFMYELNEISISDCFNKALKHNFVNSQNEINSWEQLANKLIKI